MADYYPLIARAIGQLKDNTEIARQALYDRARAALIQQLHRMDPPFKELEIDRERRALEDAIRRIEAETASRQDETSSADIAASVDAAHGSARNYTGAPVDLADALQAAIMLGDWTKALSLIAMPGDHWRAADGLGWTPLHCAAFKGHRQILELLLNKGAPPDAPDNKNKWTALHYVAAHGHDRLVAPLIKAGADPNVVSGPDRNTPLHLAAAGLPKGFSTSIRVKSEVPSEASLRKQTQSHPEVASELLRYGADPHRMCRQGYLPLQVAAERGDIPYAEALFAGGADLNKQGAQESTALHWAAAKGNAAFGKWLLAKGAQPDVADALGWTPLFLADANGTTDLVPALLAAGARTEATINGKKVRFRGAGDNPPRASTSEQTSNAGLVAAAREGRLKEVKQLLAAGANVNTRESDGCSPLIHASLGGYLEVVKVLLAVGADVNAKMSENIVALYAAAQNGHLDVVKALLAAGAEVNAAQDSGATALFMAAQDGHLEVVRALLAAGGDANSKITSGSTALMIATYNGHTAVVRALLEANAAADRKLADGTTALAIALGCGRRDIAELLMRKSASPGTDAELIEAAEAGNFSAAKAVIDGGANVNCKSRDGWTPLLSASKDSPQIVELLLAKGADPNLASSQGYTPLMRAAGNGAEKIVRMLLAAGCDRRRVDCNGKNAYQLAMEVGQRACALLVK